MITYEERYAECLMWFGGNHEAAEIFNMLCELVDTWDNLIDRDVDCRQESINAAFRVALVGLPNNRLYAALMPQLVPMWEMVISAYEVANKFEQDKDEHGLELSHTLRYAIGHMVAFLVIACVGAYEAKSILPRMWKYIISERFDEYRKEHLND
jgi:hypothetical protein